MGLETKMTIPKIAQKSPYCVEVIAQKKYAWCSCGESKQQPFCDGSHKGSGMVPVIYTPEENCILYFCGCKQSKHQPLCDGSHNQL